MSDVISIQKARYSRAESRLSMATGMGARTMTAHAFVRPVIDKEYVFRSILLLDIAAQHARLLVKEISDLSRRENFEAQIGTIEQLLQLARQMASNL
jgi:hypothetical protein